MTFGPRTPHIITRIFLVAGAIAAGAAVPWAVTRSLQGGQEVSTPMEKDFGDAGVNIVERTLYILKKCPEFFEPESDPGRRMERRRACGAKLDSQQPK
jgi:hypothetical protein